jgi:hypothetical protein
MTGPDDSEFAESVEVVSGNPSADELAAVIAVLLEARKSQGSQVLSHESTWARNGSILRTGIVVGNGQWGSKYKQGL